jgi:glycosyltransferase involved in cell wall biosynthesis
VKTLFLSHDATRTGAPMLLLTLLRWIRDESDVQFRIVLKDGGDLERDFAAVGPCTNLRWNNHPRRRGGPFGRFRRPVATPPLPSLDDVDLVYSNTITNGVVSAAFAASGRPIITHVHELENIIHQYGRENFELVKRHTTAFIAASHAVKKNLVETHGIPGDRITLVHEYLPVRDYSAERVGRPREEVLASVGIAPGAFVVGACGTTDWRKSPELFIQLAAHARKLAPRAPIHFLWVGGSLSFELRWDLEKAGLGNVAFVPHTDRTLDYFNCMDVFALTSRVDPYPLVCLEAASLGRPVLCFEAAGGMPEFVEDDCGFVIPYLDVPAMAERIVALEADRPRARALGEAARQKVNARHDITRTAPQILELMRRVAREGPS